MKIRWDWLSGDVDFASYGGKLVSPRFNHGDFDFWLVLEVINLHDTLGEETSAKYSVDVSVIAPSEVPQEDQEEARKSCGGTEKELKKLSKLALVDMLHSYGIRAIIWSQTGNNLCGLLREAKKQGESRGDTFFGFAMDAPQNAIGTTGWDMIRGDINAPLKERV